MTDTEFHDPADSNLASYEDHPVNHIEPEETGPSARQESYRKLIIFIVQCKNTKYQLACFLIATGDAEADGITMSEVARTFGVTRAAVSAMCIRICEHFGFDPSRYMRTELSRIAFKHSNIRRHARNNSFTVKSDCKHANQFAGPSTA